MIVCEKNNRYLAKNNGSPMFLCGAYDYNPIILGKSFWTPLLDDMKNKANYIRVGTFGQDGQYAVNTYTREAGSGKTASGYEGKFNLNKLNPKFFNQLKKFLIKANECNVYVQLSLFNEIFIKEKSGCGFKRNFFGNGNHVNSEEIGNVDRNNDGDGTDFNEFYDVQALKNKTNDPKRLAVAELQKKYVDTVISIANQFENVFFEIGNEILAKDWVNYWAKYISERSSLPITIPSESFTGKIKNFCGTTYHRINYDYGTKYSFIVGLDSDGDADSFDQKNPEIVRNGVWKTFTSGHGIFGNYAEVITRKTQNNSITYSNDARLTSQFMYFSILQKFIVESKFEFENSISKKTKEGLLYLENTGKQYVVYLENKKTCTLDLTKFLNKFKVSWYNTKIGSFSNITKVNGGKEVVFNTSGNYDVLYLNKK